MLFLFFWPFYLFKACFSAFSKKEKSKPVASTGRIRVEWSDEQERLKRAGYKEAGDFELFPPDTVWVGSGSKVYHYSDFCIDGIQLRDALPLSESEALRRGLRRCKKCDWHGVPVPAAGQRPAPAVKPLSRAKVTYL